MVSATARPRVTCGAASSTSTPATATSTAFDSCSALPSTWKPPPGSDQSNSGSVTMIRPMAHTPRLTNAAAALSGPRATA